MKGLNAICKRGIITEDHILGNSVEQVLQLITYLCITHNDGKVNLRF